MSAKYLLITCILFAIIPTQVLCQDVSVDKLMQYQKWRFNNKRVYLNEDEQIYRQQVFFDNLKRINAHNNQKGATYTEGLTIFADMTEEEFRQKILNTKLSDLQKQMNGENYPIFKSPRGAGYGAPVSVDWRTKGVVTPVKHQGSCGSCWTFATIGALESFNAIKNGKLQAFSEQQLVDCVSQKDGYWAWGCNGGFPQHALNYVLKNGIVTSAQYPYVGYQQSCKVTKTQGFYPKAFAQVPATVDGLKSALATSTVSVLVQADRMGYYFNGIFTNCDPPNAQKLTHAVTAVGYDAQGNWIIKNSWGTTWGEQGYMRLAAGGTCGVLMSAYVLTQ